MSGLDKHMAREERRANWFLFMIHGRANGSVCTTMAAWQVRIAACLSVQPFRQQRS